MSTALFWRTAKFELYDASDRVIGTLWRKDDGAGSVWQWYLNGRPEHGTAPTIAAAMSAAEKAAGGEHVLPGAIIPMQETIALPI
jgi:hypothetical protein